MPFSRSFPHLFSSLSFLLLERVSHTQPDAALLYYRVDCKLIDCILSKWERQVAEVGNNSHTVEGSYKIDVFRFRVDYQII